MSEHEAQLRRDALALEEQGQTVHAAKLYAWADVVAIEERDILAHELAEAKSEIRRHHALFVSMRTAISDLLWASDPNYTGPPIMEAARDFGQAVLNREVG